MLRQVAAARTDGEADMQGQGKEAWGVVVVWLADGETVGADVVIIGFGIWVSTFGRWATIMARDEASGMERLS